MYSFHITFDKAQALYIGLMFLIRVTNHKSTSMLSWLPFRVYIANTRVCGGLGLNTESIAWCISAVPREIRDKRVASRGERGAAQGRDLSVRDL